MQDASQVARGLEELATLIGLGGGAKFKVKAYEHAAHIVQMLGSDLGAFVERSGVREVHGIGSALSQQIEELWNRGTSDYLERLRGEQPEGAAELAKVRGMTARRIQALHAALGIRSVLELRAACAAGRVRTLPGFGEKTEARLLKASEERLASSGGSAPRALVMSEAWDLTRLLERELGTAAEQVHVAGALRRGEESVSCLDFVLRPSVDAGLRRLAGLRQVLRVDVAKQSAQSSAGIRIQLHEARADLGNALVLATGNAAHVEALSARAAQRGFSLASSAAARGASSDGRTPPVREFPTEAELYRGLGLSWVPPELRQGHGELEQAEKSGFEQLLTLADVRGMIHCHTTYSDGQHSVLDMARAAYALGMQYIAITDHSPTAHYAKGVALDRLHRQWDEIAAAQEQVPIRILRGTESDILANGQLDYPDAVLEQLEVVIASIHARYRATRTAMTERLIRALSLPIFKIWGHPLGRIIGHRDAIECDLPAVLDALAQSPGAVEINADPHRLDLPSSLIPAVRARGIPFILSADAHSTSGFGVLRFGVSTARRGGVNRSEVLNTLPCETFAARVQPVAKATTS